MPVHQRSDEQKEVEDDDESRSWLVVLVHDGGITRPWSPGMDGGAVSGDVGVRCSDHPCELADSKRHVLPSASTACLFGTVACRIVGATAMDPLGATDRNKCQGRRWVLLSGAGVVLGILESKASTIVGSRRAHIVFASDRHTTLQ